MPEGPEHRYESYDPYDQRVGRMEIQVRSNLDRDQFLVLYLVRWTIFWISYASLDTDTYRDTFCFCFDTEPVSWVWFADSPLLYRTHLGTYTHPCWFQHFQPWVVRKSSHDNFQMVYAYQPVEMTQSSKNSYSLLSAIRKLIKSGKWQRVKEAPFSGWGK